MPQPPSVLTVRPLRSTAWYLFQGSCPSFPRQVLDEATSALDNETEAAIMDSINILAGKKTLVIIAHRLQTIEKCNMVYRVENGKISRER